ncbi:MAG: molybdate ABC transporter substrate-binding protein [Campylobacterota bacterium]|nr:molybdate ABC transporter substrate-binding protein [Campylobacterota bacterium]
MLKNILLLTAFLSSNLFSGSINIAVAANVSYAIETIKKEFNKTHPNIKVNVTLGSSGKLTAQIKNGAPYELFMSANMIYPEALYSDKIATTKPLVYAQGSLAYLSTKKQDFTQGIKLLQSSSIDKIAIANPKTAPYGKAAVEAMQNAGVYENIVSKFVYAESASQTVSYTVTAADIGFIPKSSLYSSHMTRFKEGVHYTDVNPKLYTPISQGIVLLKNSKNASDAKKFYDFVLSDKSKKILTDFGYLVP